MLAVASKAVTELSAASALPRTQAALARAVNALYARAAPRPLTLAGSSPNPVWQLRWSSRQQGRDAIAARQAYRFRVGSHTGWLGINSPALAALIGERRSDLLPRDLRYVLLASALHPIADALEKALHLRFEWAPPEADSTDAPLADAAAAERAIGFTITSKDTHHGGHLLFDDDDALGNLLAALPLPPVDRAPMPSLDWLRIPLPFTVGRSHIRLREIATIKPGDIVSIEEWGSSGAALLVTAELGGPEGRHLVGLAEGSRITLQQLKETAMNRDNPPPDLAGDDDNAANLPLDRLDSLEVTLRFEVGDLSLSLGDLKSIRAGHVFELTQPLNRSAVRILAHGNVLGKGYLVAVGDQLGVRVSEFAPSEL